MTAPADLDRRLAELHREMSEIYAAKARAGGTSLALDQRPAPDEILTIREACARQRWSYSWAVRRWSNLGGYRDIDGRLKIKASKLADPHTAHRSPPERRFSRS